MRKLPIANPPNPWASTEVEYVGEPAFDDDGTLLPPVPNAPLTIFEETGKSILSENDSPDIGFRWSANPYRGCAHACAYCYARPSHQYWSFGAGTDFDRKIVVKTNAAALMREAFERRSWTGELVMLSGNTDCYQPLEATYRLTRAMLEECLRVRNPVWVITKSALVRRDLDLLVALTEKARVGVSISIPFADEEVARAVEPYASSVAARFETIRRLSSAGVRVGVNVAPVIPGLSDTDLPEILERAKEAGAQRAAIIALRLPREVLPVFTERITAAFPARAAKIFRAVEEMRGGKMNDSAFGARMRGLGPRWAMIERLFATHAKRLGLRTREMDHEGAADEPTTFARPGSQRSLFDLG